MTENDHFIGRIEDYLVEFDGATPLPDRVIDAIHAELPRTRQVKASPGLMRMPAMLTTISSRAPWGPAALAKVGVTAVAVVAIGVVGLTFLRPPSVGPAADLGIFAPVSGRLVYGDEDGIWGVDPASSDPTTRVELTSETGIPLGWSSDGARLLIMRGSGVDEHLVVLHADGSETQVTTVSMLLLPRLDEATISPDGSRVAFRAGFRAPEGGCCNWALYAVDANGGPAEMLVESQIGVVRTPTFSPDGTKIAYVEDTYVDDDDDVDGVWLVDADGTDAHQIVPDPGAGEVTGLAWSPTGDRIALGLGDATFTFRPDGSDLTEVIPGGGRPFWSPDGSHIAYQGASGLAIADADGSNVREFGFGASGPWHPGSPIDDAPPTPAETSKSVETPPSQTLPPSPLTERFDSTLNGISIDYPTGWQTRPATEPWMGGELDFESPMADVIFDPALGDRVYVALASLPTEGEIDVEGFVAGFCRGMGGEGWSVFGGVGGVPAQGRSCGNNGRTYITVEPLGRSYLILKVVASDEPGLAERFNWNWFEPMLESVTLRPNAAVQGASPSASP